jgi:2-oxoglutarate ferredoxin oxidoreductase subunit beta
MIPQAQLPVPSTAPVAMKDLFAENPRWCAGCGDFGILASVKKFLIDRQLRPEMTMNVSGIGCSSRAPNYINTYGAHSIHGRAIPVATGIALARPDLHLFIHSGDGDSMSIGGNHLLHGINKNFNCVFLMYDNEIYALTKNQTSPTTRKDHPTNTQPLGTFLSPINPITVALGLGASFVASSADWIPDHLTNTIKAAYDHPGFAFIHISQRCVHFDPANFNVKTSGWFSFLKHPNGIEPDRRLAEKTRTFEHDPSDIAAAFKLGTSERRYYGLFYQDRNKPRYDSALHTMIANATKKDRTRILDPYKI